MVIIGLGSNVGDRLAHFRQALTALRALDHLTVLRVSPVYESDALLPEDAPEEWRLPHLNAAISAETTLSPETLLQALKALEETIGRTKGKRWSPRILDLDLLAWDDRVLMTDRLTLPHRGLAERPFALWPLADVAPQWRHPTDLARRTAAEMVSAWGSRFDGNAPLHTRQIPHRIDTPQLIGIVNITPDSFAGDGVADSIEAAITRAKQHIATGADIIDLGAESTRPGATLLTPAQESERLFPVLTTLLAECKQNPMKPRVSIDTRHAEVAEKALSLGVDWINDVSGFSDPAMLDLAAHTQATFVFMHQLGLPASREHTLSTSEDPINAILAWGEKRFQQCLQVGIDPSHLIFDVGIGFGKTPSQSLQLLKQIEKFHVLNLPLLVGHSRKSPFTLYTDRPASERGLETVVSSLCLLNKPVDYLRVHDVAEHARAFKVFADLG